MNTLEIIGYILFAIGVIPFLHSYLFYPFLLFVFGLISKKKYQTSDAQMPFVSVLISAYNEQNVIEETIRTLLKTEYPLEKIEIVIGSDASSDATNSIIASLAAEFPQIRFFSFPTRRGKASVLNDLARESRGTILVFADANTLYRPDALPNLVKYFADERIGGVCGRLCLRNREGDVREESQENVYWSYETLLKRLEGNLGILIGANGGIYAIRKEYFCIVPREYPVADDFFISMKVFQSGKEVCYANDAVAEEYNPTSDSADFTRKIRVYGQAMMTAAALRPFSSLRFRRVILGLYSHKVLRWLTPLWLLCILTGSALLSPFGVFFSVLCLFEAAVVFLALVGFFFKRSNIRFYPAFVCYFFVMIVIAMSVGLYRFLTKTESAIWNSTPRT